MPDTPKINPAWQELLSKIPEAMHGVVVPVLQKWDAGVTTKFQELHTQYEPLKAYKNLADHGIDPQYAEQAIMLADRMQSNPKQIAEQLNSSFNLGFISPEEAAKLGQRNSPDGGSDDDFFNDPDQDITKHPQFKALADQIKSFQEQFEQTTQQQQEQQQVEQFEAYLDELEEDIKGKNLPFNRRYITALMTQGMSGEDAVKEYHQDLAIEAVNESPANETPTDEPPIVMGGEGSTGGGTPDGSIRFGDLPKNDLNKTVADLLEAQLNSGQ